MSVIEQECDHVGHDWCDAGGGMQICAVCETEREYEPETCVFCGEEPDGGEFNDGQRCKKCAEEQDAGDT